MTGFPRVNLMNSTIVLFINIILNYLWIPQYKIMGAAYATLVSMTILAIMRLIEVKMIVKIQPFSIKMLKPIIAGIAMAVVLYGIKPIIFPLHTLLTLSAAVIAGGIIFYVMLWLMKFDRDDKEIWSGISMIIKRNKDS
jgi:O-antigen/teichoic acid export membrane protein